MIFRLKIFIPLVLIVAGCYFATQQVSAPLASFFLEKNIPGLRIDKLNLSSSPDHWSLESKAFYHDDEGTLVSVGNAKIDLQPKPLGFGEIVARGELENVMISPRVFHRKTYTTKGENGTEGSSTGESPSEDAKDSSFSIKDLDHRDVLERFTGTRELATETKIREGKATVDQLKDKWTKRYQELEDQAKDLRQKKDTWKNNWQQTFQVDDLKTRVENLKQQFESLKSQKFDLKNIEQLTSNIQQVQSLTQEVKDLKTQVEQIKAKGEQEIASLKNIRTSLEGLKNSDEELKQDLGKLKQLNDDILVSGKSDIELLKKELDPREFDAAKLTRLLLGREWELQLKTYLDALETIMAKIPDQKEDTNTTTTAEVTTKRSREFVNFQREEPRPQWNIEELSYTGIANNIFDGQDVPFKGVLSHLSSDEATLKKTPSLSLKGELPSRGGQFELDGLYSQIHDAPEYRRLKFKLRGRSMKGGTMGAPSMRLQFQEGQMALDIEIDLASAPHWVVKGQIHLTQLQFSAANSVKEHMRAPLQEAATRLFSQPIGFNYRYPGPIRFEGDLKDVVGSVFKGALSSLASQEQAKLTEKLQQRFQEKMGQQLAGTGLESVLSDQFPALTNLIGQDLQSLLSISDQSSGQLNSVGGYQQILENMLADSLGLKGGRDQLQDQLKQRAADEIKQRLANELRERAEKELKSKLEQEMLVKAQEALKIKTEQELKQKAEEALRLRLEQEKRKAEEDVKRKLEEEAKKKLKDTFKGFSF